MKMASLFDGIGGFPLASIRAGITPVWASEIEKVPCEITKKHFPSMKHYGDVTQINGAEVEPVDVITFGSPCQDLSVAGKRAGLDGERSGLFGQAVRIIKEMRNATNGTFPRFAVWENVPGAYSSNGGQDFRTVIEELIRIRNPKAEVPMPADRWEPAGMAIGKGYSLAWRTLDAQYWGVPQRRKRIFVVADFAGASAGQILFEPESLRRNPASGRGAGQGAAAGAEGGTGECIGFDHSKGGESLPDKTPPPRAKSNPNSNPCVSGGMSVVYPERKTFSNAGFCGFTEDTIAATQRACVAKQSDVDLVVENGDGECYGIDQQGGKGQANFTVDVAPPMCSDSHGTPHVVCFEPRSQDGVPRYHGDGPSPTLNTAQGGQRQPCVAIQDTRGIDKKQGGPGYSEKDVMYTLDTMATQGVAYAVRMREGCDGGGKGPLIQTDKSGTIATGNDQTIFAPTGFTMQAFGEYKDAGAASSFKQRDYKDATDLVAEPICGGFKYGNSAQARSVGWQEECAPTLAGSPGGNQIPVALAQYKVRRLTPTECERLQGFPDGWTEGFPDTARYKALGNSVAVPCVEYVMRGIANHGD